jgi:hypothetical protein
VLGSGRTPALVGRVGGKVWAGRSGRCERPCRQRRLCRRLRGGGNGGHPSSGRWRALRAHRCGQGDARLHGVPPVQEPQLQAGGVEGHSARQLLAGPDGCQRRHQAPHAGDRRQGLHGSGGEREINSAREIVQENALRVCLKALRSQRKFLGRMCRRASPFLPWLQASLHCRAVCVAPCAGAGGAGRSLAGLTAGLCTDKMDPGMSTCKSREVYRCKRNWTWK